MRVLLRVALVGWWIRLTTSKKVRLIALRQNKDLAYLSERAEAGQLAPVIDGPYKLSEAPEALVPGLLPPQPTTASASDARRTTLATRVRITGILDGSAGEFTPWWEFAPSGWPRARGGPVRRARCTRPR